LEVVRSLVPMFQICFPQKNERQNCTYDWAESKSAQLRTAAGHFVTIATCLYHGSQMFVSGGLGPAWIAHPNCSSMSEFFYGRVSLISLIRAYEANDKLIRAEFFSRSAFQSMIHDKSIRNLLLLPDFLKYTC
jgi:hypothetical protein